LEDRVYSVLMVEDDVNHYKILVRFIERSGKPIKVDLVTTAPEFFNVFLAKNYDLIMLDYNLSHYTGLSILKKLNELEIPVPVIMVTQQRDPEVAITAMKMGAVDYIIKSKKSFQRLPEQILEIIRQHEEDLATNHLWRLKRRSLLQSHEVREALRLLQESKEGRLTPRVEVSHYHQPGHRELGVDKERLEKILQVLTLNRILSKKPVGVKIVCPRCESDDVETIPRCPRCGGRVFVKNTGPGAPFRCLSGCGETFSEVRVGYRCNACFKEFTQEESRYKHVYVYRLNPAMVEEVTQLLESQSEVQIWEEKNKEYTKTIRETKEMHEEIKNQLRELIEQQIRRS